MTTLCEICSCHSPASCRITIEQDGSRLTLEICPACRDRLLEAVPPWAGMLEDEPNIERTD